MKTYLAGFLIFAAALYWLTGCASHKLAVHEARVVIPQKQPSPPARPLYHFTPRIAPVAHDTIRDTVFIREIQHKHKRRPCKA